MILSTTFFKIFCELKISSKVINPYAAGGYFEQYKMIQKILKDDGNPGKWVLI